MADFGATISSKVNSSMAKVKITFGAVTSELLLLQDLRDAQSATEYREPTTSSGPVYYSGQPANRLQGTVLFTTDAWKNATNNFNILLARTNGEKPVFKCVVTYVDSQASPITDTFTWDPASGNSGAKMESCIRQKSPEGAVKMDISIVLIGEPVIT
jgi:hypothetical protein